MSNPDLEKTVAEEDKAPIQVLLSEGITVGKITVDKVLKVMSVVILILGFIGSFVISADKYGDLDIVRLLICWISLLLFCVPMYGFGKVIELLQKIADK